MVKNIMKWTDKKFEEIDENTKHPFLKSFGLGAIEGFIDAAVLVYPILLVTCCYAVKKLSKNND